MFYPCNAETENMNQGQLAAYYDGANAALEGADCLPGKVYINPSCEIADAYRAGYKAQKGEMAVGSSLI